MHSNNTYITITRIIATTSKDSCKKRHHVQVTSTSCMDKVSRSTAFCAWDSSPHLPVTPAQLMRRLVLAEMCPAQWRTLHNILTFFCSGRWSSLFLHTHHSQFGCFIERLKYNTSPLPWNKLTGRMFGLAWDRFVTQGHFFSPHPGERTWCQALREMAPKALRRFPIITSWPSPEDSLSNHTR